MKPASGESRSGEAFGSQGRAVAEGGEDLGEHLWVARGGYHAIELGLEIRWRNGGVEVLGEGHRHPQHIFDLAHQICARQDAGEGGLGPRIGLRPEPVAIVDLFDGGLTGDALVERKSLLGLQR
jgi:hypothetical protein